jgi:hypothetical protein
LPTALCQQRFANSALPTALRQRRFANGATAAGGERRHGTKDKDGGRWENDDASAWFLRNSRNGLPKPRRARRRGACGSCDQHVDRSVARAFAPRGPNAALSHAIAANVGEGIGSRGEGDKKRSFEIPREEAEETIRHLNVNFRAGRINRESYWPPHNLLTVVVKMLTALLP